MRLGTRQLELLSSIAGTHRALVVPDKLARGLAAKGLLVSMARAPKNVAADAFLVLTPTAYRAVADALEDGRIPRGTVEEWNAARKGGKS